jgi:hypothetical protein
MTATRYTDGTTGRSWLEFPGKPDADTIAALKGNGWRWSGFRKCWHNPRKAAAVPAGIEVTDGGTVEWAAERADRLDARAGKAAAAADGYSAQAHAIADLIPFGQPILRGHHSEGRSRRDAARIHSAYDKSGEAHQKAERLSGAADASRAHRAHLAAPGTISRRLDKLRAELRAAERSLSARRCIHGYRPDICVEGGCDGLPTQEPLPATVAHWTGRAEALRAEIAEGEADLTAAGGLKADVLVVAVGDVIRIKGHVVRVSRVNPKSYSGTILLGGARGMDGKWDQSHLRSIIARAGDALPDGAE